MKTLYNINFLIDYPILKYFLNVKKIKNINRIMLHIYIFQISNFFSFLLFLINDTIFIQNKRLIRYKNRLIRYKNIYITFDITSKNF